MRILLVCVALLGGCKKSERAEPFADTARACTRDSEMSCPRPIFTVQSLRASQAYYRDALGFKVAWDHGDPPNFGAVRRADVELFMCEGCQGKPGAWMMVFAHDVDKLYDEYKRTQAIIQMPPTDMPWGMREMHIADPDGNVIRFGMGLDHD